MMFSNLDYTLITAIRYDPALLDAPFNTTANDGTPSAFLFLQYHHARLLHAASVHGDAWRAAGERLTWGAFKSACVKAVEGYTGEGCGGPLKVRIALDVDGRVDITLGSVPPLPTPLDPFLASSYSPDDTALPSSRFLPPLTLFLDTQPTPSSVYTATKTSRRAHYDAARRRFSIALGGTEDVVLWNEERDVMETSVRNVAFWRGGGWVTPGEGCGCLEGVVRRWLVEREVVRVGLVKRNEVRDGENVLVFNAVEGCRLGVVKKV